MLRAVAPLTAAVVALAIAGCGNDKTAAPDTGAIPAPKDFREANYADAGIALKVPSNWRVVEGESPQVATIAAGEGQIGVWRFPRKEPLPETAIQLSAALQALIAQVHKRDPTFAVTSSRVVVKPKLKAVEVIGIGKNQGVRRQQRSLHAYAHGGEIVIDGFAPVDDFARVDKQTLAKVTRSLKVSKPKP